MAPSFLRLPGLSSAATVGAGRRAKAPLLGANRVQLSQPATVAVSPAASRAASRVVKRPSRLSSWMMLPALAGKAANINAKATPTSSPRVGLAPVERGATVWIVI